MTKLSGPLEYSSLPPLKKQAASRTPERNLSLDLLKAAAILMVIFYHNGQLNPASVIDNLVMLLPSAAVPCFFMASGAVFFHRPFDMQKHLRRILRFYLTVVAWKAVYLILYRYWGAPADGSLRNLLSYLFLFQHLDGVGTAHFWFMDAMLTVMLAAPVLYLCYHVRDNEETQPGRQGTVHSVRAHMHTAHTHTHAHELLPGHSQLLLFLLAVLVLFNQFPAAGNLLAGLLARIIGKPEWNLSPLGEINPFSFRYSNYFTYYLLGALLIEYKETISARAAAALTLLGTAGLLCIKYIQTGSFCWNGVYLESGYYWFSTMLLASGLFLLATQHPVREHSGAGWIAKHVGSATMGIFYLHVPLIYILSPMIFSRLEAYHSWWLNLAEACLVAGVSLVFVKGFRMIKTLAAIIPCLPHSPKNN